MKVKVEFEDGDFDTLHDIVFDITGKQLNNTELELVWSELPEDIKNDSIHFGLNDSVVRDSMYEYLQQTIK